MYSDWTAWILPLVVSVWLLGLTILILRERSLHKAFFPRSGERDIRKKFEEILGLEEKLDRLDRKSLENIQKVALLRYNPYQDTGGNISFSLALLNAQGSGFVITSLHSRSGTRVFAKPVITGKAENYKFSDEEDEVVKRAIKS